MSEAAGEEDGEADRLPVVSRTYERMEKRRIQPAYVETVEKNYLVDHAEALDSVVRLVNYDDDGDLAEVVSFPWHRIEAIEYYPAEEAIENSPYDGFDPLARGETDE